MNNFELTQSEQQQIDKWLQDEVYPEAIEMDRQRLSPEDFDDLTLGGRYPYNGAIGGSLTYHFTPTSLGVVKKITDSKTGKELDLTDYDSW